MVNLPFFWMASFWDFMMNWARDSTSSSGFEKEQRMGADGACVLDIYLAEEGGEGTAAAECSLCEVADRV